MHVCNIVESYCRFVADLIYNCEYCMHIFNKYCAVAHILSDNSQEKINRKKNEKY